MDSQKKRDAAGGVEGMLRGLGDLLEKLGTLAEKGEQLKRSGEFDIKGDAAKDLKGFYGFSVKMGLGNNEPTVEPFGNIKRDAQTGEAVVRETAEPMVDVFEEEDHIRVVVEIPGVGNEDVKLDLAGDLLSIHAERGTKKYYKEVLLPRACEASKMDFNCRNGILEIKCR